MQANKMPFIFQKICPKNEPMPPSRPWKIKAFEQENPVKLNDKVTTIKWEMK